jgi:hypothetical protein
MLDQSLFRAIAAPPDGLAYEEVVDVLFVRRHEMGEHLVDAPATRARLWSPPLMG